MRGPGVNQPSTAPGGSSRSSLLSWLVLAVALVVVAVVAIGVWLSYVHPYAYGVTLRPATIVAKQEQRVSGDHSRADTASTYWQIDARLADGGDTASIRVGIHHLYGKDVGDQIEIYQVDGGWKAREYTSPVRLGLYGLGLIFVVALPGEVDPDRPKQPGPAVSVGAGHWPGRRRGRRLRPPGSLPWPQSVASRPRQSRPGSPPGPGRSRWPGWLRWPDVNHDEIEGASHG